MILFVADGMGLFNIRRDLGSLPFLNRITGEGKIAPMTSVFPSTTAASMTSIYTGREPLTHGLLEWYMFLDETGIVVETLPFKAHNPAEQRDFQKIGLRADMLFEGDAATDRLLGEGIACTAYLPQEITDSPFSMAVMGNTVRKGYDRLDDIISELGRRKGTRTFTMIYYPEVDAAGHVYGPSSPDYLMEMGKVDLFLSQLSGERGDDTAILFTADHGQLEVDPAETLYLDELEWFDDMLQRRNGRVKIPPYGSPRDVIIRARDGGATCSVLNERLGDYGVAKTTEWMTQNGYFGRGRKALRFDDRAGSVWFLPHEGKTVWYRHYKGERFALRGMHGGLTPQEVMVPLAVI